MMTLEDYALDVNKSIEEIMKMCDKIGISYQDDQTLLSDEDIILLDNDIQDSEDYIEGDLALDEYEEEQLLDEEVADKAEELAKNTKFDLDNAYNEYVDDRIIKIMKEKVSEYNSLLLFAPSESATNMEKINFEQKQKKKYLEILYSNPAGFELTARMTTNYRCLKNIYKQRKNHRLPEWREFCEWIETLPYAKELIIGEE